MVKKYTLRFEKFLRRNLRRPVVVDPDSEYLFMVRYAGDDLSDGEIIDTANRFFKRGGLYWRSYQERQR